MTDVAPDALRVFVVTSTVNFKKELERFSWAHSHMRTTEEGGHELSFLTWISQTRQSSAKSLRAAALEHVCAQKLQEILIISISC